MFNNIDTNSSFKPRAVLWVAMLCLLYLGVVDVGYSYPVSADQVELFNNLSPEQKRKLAEQAGVDIDLRGKKGAASPPLEIPDTVVPRKVENRRSKIIPTERHQEYEDLDDKTLENELREDLTEIDAHRIDPFGYDLFAGTPSTFAPVTDVPVPSDYVIGPNDIVVVQLYGKQNIVQELRVNREGQIQFPEIGPLSVAGMSYRELKSYLAQIVAEKMIGVTVSISMGSLRSIRIFVLGEAYRPGSYTVSALSTITNALFVSGGVTDVGSLRHIQLKRNGKIVGELDLYDLLLSGDTSGDIKLRPGDVIFIPTIGKTVGVAGEVKRPAIYELNREQTVGEILRLAGGLSATAYPAATRIERINEDGHRTIVDVDVSQKQGGSTKVFDSDLIHVYSVLDSMEKIVTLEGHVKRPGGFAWREGLRVSDIVASEYDLLPIPDLNYALISRERPPTRETELVSFSLAQAFANPGTEFDPVLKNRDEILVLGAHSEERQEILQPYLEKVALQTDPSNPLKLVSVSGNVRFPGSYPLTKNMTVKDLILASGGFKESAYRIEAEITRSKIVDNKNQEFERIKIGLSKSGEISLQSRDQLYIKKIPNWADKKTASIEGEVRFPGEYPIFKGDTIVDLITRAGGFTEFAQPEAAVFLREDLRKREQEQLDRYKARLQRDLAELKIEAQKNPENSEKAAVGDSLLSQLTVTEAVGRLVIDLSSMLEEDGREDIELKDKDRLMIPPHSLEVSVMGEVQFPVSHIYENGKNVFDYIKNSGGYTYKADTKRIFVVKSNGEVAKVRNGWFRPRRSGVDPGDTVVVPYDTYSVSPMTYWETVSKILFQLASTAAALKTVGAL